MFAESHWLLLSIPLLWFVIQFRPLSRINFVLRLFTIIALILALAGLQFSLPRQEESLIVLADRSLSMPKKSTERINETIDLLFSQMPDNAKMSVISFAADAQVNMPLGRSSFSGFSRILNTEASNINDAIELALNIIPEDSFSRLILISDGLWTGKNPTDISFKAATRGVPIDYRFLSRNTINDLSIAKFEVPGLLETGEVFIINADIMSPFEQNALVELYCDERLIYRTSQKVLRGRNSLSFKDSAGSADILQYRLRVTADNVEDPFPENNEARAISEIRGIMPVLLISESASSPLISLLEKNNRAFEVRKPHEINWSLEFLAGYSGIILENISANRLGLHAMQIIKAWVQHLGGGLFMTGGKNSFGNGGYYMSALEPILPVTMELRSAKQKIPMAMIVVLDRSGSMSAAVQDRRTKMDLANIAAVSSMELLSPVDEFGLLAVDTEVHDIIPLQTLSDSDIVKNKILSINSQGGGIYIEKGLKHAYESLVKSKIKNRHIILFADASDAEKPGDYKSLLEKCFEEGITCSVIGLGQNTDTDANLLSEIAEAGNGRVFFTNDPIELPRLFAQDTFVAARSAYVEQFVTIKTSNAINLLLGEPLNISSEVDTYNLCYPRSEAIIAMKTIDDNEAPIVAAWQQGLGRVACYMGVIDANQSFLSHFEGARIITGLCNWIVTDTRQTIDNMPVTQSIKRGIWKATLHLDPERQREIFAEDVKVTVLRSLKNMAPKADRLIMNWDTADSLSVSLSLSGNETVVSMIDAGNNQKLRLYPVCQPYSQEYSIPVAENGRENLADIADITGGIELIDLSRAWKSISYINQSRNISNWLICLAIILFILEIIERRTSLLSILMPFKRTEIHSLSVFKNSKSAKIKPLRSDVALSSKATVSEESTAKVKNKNSQFSSALKKAKKQASQRTENYPKRK